MKCIVALANLGLALACNAGSTSALGTAWLIAASTWLALIGAEMVHAGLVVKGEE